MTLCSAGRLLTILTMIFVPSLAHSESASPAAQTVIEELNLTESTKQQAMWSWFLTAQAVLYLRRSYSLTPMA